MKYFLSILIVFVSFIPSYAEVNIPSKCWIPNKPGGYCVYCAIETIGRYYKIKWLYGIVDHYSKWPSVGAGTKEVKSCLNYLEVPYEIYENTSIDWLKKQTSNGIPIVVGLKWTKGQHAIIVVDVNDEWVKYIDSNDTTKYHKVNLDWFVWAWNPQWAILIYNNNN